MIFKILLILLLYYFLSYIFNYLIIFENYVNIKKCVPFYIVLYIYIYIYIYIYNITKIIQ